jgi:hypothetical protein
MKSKTNLFLILVCLLGLLLIIAPIQAKPEPTGIFTDSTTINSDYVTTYTYTADPGYAIGNIVIMPPIGSHDTFTLTYGNGSTVSGTVVYIPENILGIDSPTNSVSTVSIGGDSQTRNFIDAHSSPEQAKITGYARDTDAGTVGFGIWDAGVGLWSDQIAYYSVPNSTNRLISSVTITGDKPFKVTLGYGTAAYIASANNKSALDVLNDWIQLAISLAATIIGVITGIIWYLKFFFVDNGLLIIALYLAVSMAYSAMSSVSAKGFDVFRFMKKFIGFQQSLYRFIIDMWTQLVTIVSWFAQIFKLI